MAVYLGKKILMLSIGGVSYAVNFKFGEALTLLSKDGNILKDSNGVYFKAKWGD